MKKNMNVIIIINIIIILIVIIGFLVIKNIREPNHVVSPIPCIPSPESNMVLEAHPFTFTEEEIILEDKDFFYTNKEAGFTLRLGITREEMLDITSQNDRRLAMTYKREVVCGIVRKSYSYDSEGFTFEDDSLVFVIPDGEHHFVQRWQTYGNINYDTGREGIIEVLGEPTIYEELKSMTYIFFKTEDGMYQKLRNREEVEWFASRKAHAIQMRVIDFPSIEPYGFTTMAIRALTESDYVEGTLRQLLDRKLLFEEDN